MNKARVLFCLAALLVALDQNKKTKQRWNELTPTPWCKTRESDHLPDSRSGAHFWHSIVSFAVVGAVEPTVCV